MKQFTIEDMLKRAADQCTFLQATKVHSEAPYVTIITGVPKTLEPKLDFSFNGDALVTGRYDEILASHGSVLLSSLGDYRVTNSKVIFSAEPFTDEEMVDVFHIRLAMRILEVNEGHVKYITLRNAFGDDLLTCHLTDEA